MTRETRAHATTIGDWVRSLPQRVYPKRLASALMFRATRVRYRPWKDWQIRWFIRRYGVDMGLAEESDPGAYPDFNTFFTRSLRREVRACEGDEHTAVSPADGVLSQLGRVSDGALIEAKGRGFSLERLLGGDAERCAPFRDGQFATVYLSPRDYHRVHMPLAGHLREMVYVPGRLFSVSPATEARIPGLFARNERVVSLFETASGPMAVVLVGAVFVGSIEIFGHGRVMPPRGRIARVWRYAPGEGLDLARGAELGRFNMGSTVITILGTAGCEWVSDVHAGVPVTVGQALARVAPPDPEL